MGGDRAMRCYICDLRNGEEAGWFVCRHCQAKYPHLSQAIMTGEVVSGRDSRGALVFKPVVKADPQPLHC